jgi:protein required for attachment to host cells
MKKDTWVVVANSSQARIFRAENNQLLQEIEILEHPESREKESELVTSRPGRSFDRVGTGRHAIEPKTSPKLQEFVNFARFLSNHLEEARLQGKFGRLYLAAGPSFLGLLRQSIEPSILQLIAEEVDKDITHLNEAEIREYLPIVL